MTNVFSQQQHLLLSPLAGKTNSTPPAKCLGDLEQHTFAVDGSTPGKVIASELERNPDLPGVIILDGARYSSFLGMISRQKFFECIGQPYGVEVYLNRPISVMFGIWKAHPLVLPADTRIEDALRICLSRSADRLYEPVVVLHGAAEFRLLDFRTLLIAETHLLGEANTRLEKMNAELEQARKAAEQADRFKSEFLAHMSHELRTPLNAILNFTEFVVDGLMGEVNADQVETLQNVISSGNHLLSLINDVLDISKIEAGMMKLFIEKVDLKAVLEATLSVATGLVKGKPVEVEAQIQENLPQINGDRRRIRQIFLNLVSNAVKFTPQGKITIQASFSEYEILVVVKDTGIGITPEDQEAIFEPFKQARHELRDVSGTGLGLPICRHFIQAHGGSIWVESQPGIGSTFYVSLPVDYMPVESI